MPCCRQIIQNLLDGLEGKCRAVDSAAASSCAACLVRLTHMLADAHASFAAGSAPEDFVELLAEGARQCCALCIACACQPVQTLNLRLATSDLFHSPSSAAAGMLALTKTKTNCNDIWSAVTTGLTLLVTRSAMTVHSKPTARC